MLMIPGRVLYIKIHALRPLLQLQPIHHNDNIIVKLRYPLLTALPLKITSLKLVNCNVHEQLASC